MAAADAAEAIVWFVAERSVLLALIDLAVEAGLDRHAWHLSWTLAPFLQRQGYWNEQLSMLWTALGAARRLDDQIGLAFAHRWLGSAQAELGQLPAAADHLRQAAELHRTLGEPVGEAGIHMVLAVVAERQGHHEEALRHAQQAHEIFGRAALAVLRETDALVGLSRTLDSIGYIHHRMGRYDESIASYREAIDLYRRVGDRYNEADGLGRLAEVHRDAGNRDAARTAWRRALAILDDLGHPDAEAIRARQVA